MLSTYFFFHGMLSTFFFVVKIMYCILKNMIKFTINTNVCFVLYWFRFDGFCPWNVVNLFFFMECYQLFFCGKKYVLYIKKNMILFKRVFLCYIGLDLMVFVPWNVINFFFSWNVINFFFCGKNYVLYPGY